MNAVTAVGKVGVRRLSVFQGLGAPRKNETPMGLNNNDNSCYQNSILQGLASLGSFTEYLSSSEMDSGYYGDARVARVGMVDALKQLIADLNDPTNNGRRRWTPSVLKNMNSSQQQDAQEYYSGVLDAIEKEKGKDAKVLLRANGLALGDLPKVWGDINRHNIQNPLEGMTGQRVACKACGHSDGLPLTPFNCLTVPLARVQEQDLQSCLDEYTELEPIDDMNCVKCTLVKFQSLFTNLVDRTKDSSSERVQQACADAQSRLDAVNQALEDDDFEEKTLREKCKIESKQQVKSSKTRQTVIARPSKSLVIHLQRSVFDGYAGRFVKNYSKLWFPKYLDLSSWCLGSTGTSQTNGQEEWLLDANKSMVSGSKARSRFRGPLYQIRGVVTHEGHHEDGHYICYRKQPVQVAEGEQPKDQWWRLSDAHVRQASEDEVFGRVNRESIFMLFYECVDPAIRWNVLDNPNYFTSSVEKGESVKESLIEHTEESRTSVEFDTDASLKLPPEDGAELSDSNSQRMGIPTHQNERDVSLNSAVSESDNEEIYGEDRQPSHPVQPIVIAPYVPRPENDNDAEGTKSQGLESQRPLVMV